jgi:signal peptidase II
MNFTKRLILVFVVLVSCVGCDQATKSIAVSTLPETRTFSYIGDILRLQLTYNRGAFLSFGYSLPDVWRHSLFTIGVGFFLIGALTIFRT